MPNMHKDALEALRATIEYAQETSRLIKRSEDREKLSAQLVAKSRDQLRRSRARLGGVATDTPDEQALRASEQLRPLPPPRESEG
jgi:hypothetical protein